VGKSVNTLGDEKEKGGGGEKHKSRCEAKPAMRTKIDGPREGKPTKKQLDNSLKSIGRAHRERGVGRKALSDTTGVGRRKGTSELKFDQQTIAIGTQNEAIQYERTKRRRGTENEAERGGHDRAEGKARLWSSRTRGGKSHSPALEKKGVMIVSS